MSAPLSRSTRPALRRAPALVLAGALALSLAACGDEDSSPTASSPAPSVSVDAALAAKVPASVKADGKILVGSDTSYAPSEFLDADGSTVKGFDVDLFKVVAAKLGLKAEFQSSVFDTIIAGVSSGKYEVGVSSFTINADRLKQVNMVSYFSAGTLWATPAGNPAGVSIEEPCGKKIAVQKGTVQVDDITARSKKCTDAGKPAVTIDQYQGQDQATTAVVTGKDEAMLADSPVTAYAVQQTNGKLALLGDIYDSAPYGYVVPKDQADFAEALAGAVKAAIADGSYAAALKTWGVESGAITDPAVNPAP
ncbi:MAG: ABC transporter substrate-binding protein [Kineosporiaceae bacterium]